MMSVVSVLDRLLERVASVVKYGVVGIIALVIFEVLSRSLFNQSFTWTREIAQWLGAAIILLGGAHALNAGNFVRVDIFYVTLSKRIQACIDLLLGTVCFGLVAYVLIKHGGKFAIDSVYRLETSTAVWAGPVWVAKLLIPAGGVLISLAWISCTLKNILMVFGVEGAGRSEAGGER